MNVSKDRPASVIPGIVRRWRTVTTTVPCLVGVLVGVLAATAPALAASGKSATAKTRVSVASAPGSHTAGQQVASAPDLPGSCDVRSVLGYCYEYTGKAWTRDSAQSDCSGAPDGQYLDDRCPNRSVVATCVIKPGGQTGREIRYVYYSPGTTVTQARMSCGGGIFKAGPDTDANAKPAR